MFNKNNKHKPMQKCVWLGKLVSPEHGIWWEHLLGSKTVLFTCEYRGLTFYRDRDTKHGKRAACSRPHMVENSSSIMIEVGNGSAFELL